jgi:hypothetical protein
MFGAVRGHATGNGTRSGDPNETTTTKAADHTAYQGRAVKAAQQIIAEACDRSIVRPEHAQFYDFVLAAARSVLDHPVVAESIGKKMPLDAWQKPPKAASSQPGSSGRPASARSPASVMRTRAIGLVPLPTRFAVWSVASPPRIRSKRAKIRAPALSP